MSVKSRAIASAIALIFLGIVFILYILSDLERTKKQQEIDTMQNLLIKQLIDLTLEDSPVNLGDVKG